MFAVIDRQLFKHLLDRDGGGVRMVVQIVLGRRPLVAGVLEHVDTRPDLGVLLEVLQEVHVVPTK